MRSIGSNIGENVAVFADGSSSGVPIAGAEAALAPSHEESATLVRQADATKCTESDPIGGSAIFTVHAGPNTDSGSLSRPSAKIDTTAGAQCADRLRGTRIATVVDRCIAPIVPVVITIWNALLALDNMICSCCTPLHTARWMYDVHDMPASA
ncbi:hypothetical protein EK21DRAFT_89224 [Setomelanomma holmii]|uniref:Uncharacterized protein n=1 Tax=Setomelanomma holmii TaxID=210430 RepID=A0A9P4LKA7_9PLEO|nr:hypothetical protein EK21DRAFT_89224 [Setomelanomma holmii]